MNVDRVATDFSVVVAMWEHYELEKDTKQFKTALAEGKAQIMLAVTAPENEQQFGWDQLKANGFKQIASGLRTSGHFGHKYLYLWGKVNRTLPKSRRAASLFSFNSCGASGMCHTKRVTLVDNMSWSTCLTVHRVMSGNKSPIPKTFELIARTKFARYYVENHKKLFATLSQ